MCILDNIVNLDQEFKTYFMTKVLNIIKSDIKKAIELKIFKEKLSFIEDNCEIISSIRNEKISTNHPDINIPSYCFYTCYDIIDEFKKNKTYPPEVSWLYLYRIINIPHYQQENDYDNINYNLNNNYINYTSDEEEYYDSY